MRCAAIVVLLLFWAAPIAAADRTSAGELVVEPPTLISLGFEWLIEEPADFDFRLRSGSAAVDAGVRLPGVNDEFTGRAPDLGAYESDRAVPAYGPRP